MAVRAAREHTFFAAGLAGTAGYVLTMDASAWTACLPRFRNLLRPIGTDPPAAAEEIVESVRLGDSARGLVDTISAALPDLVFDGYADWYTAGDEWVLARLGRVLTVTDEGEILGRLGQGTADALEEVLRYIAGGRLDAWRNAAREAPAGTADEPAMLDGTANTANWEVSRIPGTFYYAYVGDQYLYGDLPQAPVSEWQTIAVREQLAADGAQPWGGSGWFWTPVAMPDLYGGAFVYARDKHGPWMTEAQAWAALAPEPEPVPGPATAPAAQETTWEEERAAALEELFTELAALGWDPHKAETDESMPTREQVIERFDRQVQNGIMSRPAGQRQA